MDLDIGGDGGRELARIVDRGLERHVARGDLGARRNGLIIVM